ncbi:hypothetical protein LTR85_011601 [Meristemomyces frigidus]|nr:hypothetical protein LTR85_011601 [Meristemomyces frigidus]
MYSHAMLIAHFMRGVSAIMSRTPSLSSSSSSHSSDLEIIEPVQLTRPRKSHNTKKPTAIATTRGRPQKRLTSSKRVSPKAAGSKKLSPRKPLTPTTKTANAKERKHKQYVKKRAAEAEVEKILRMPSTYWRVLRNGKQYRSFGGARAR